MGLVANQNDQGIQIRGNLQSARDADTNGASNAALPMLVADDIDFLVSKLFLNLRPIPTRDDHDRRASHGGLGRSLEQRFPAQREKLLGVAQTGRTARSQDDSTRLFHDQQASAAFCRGA